MSVGTIFNVVSPYYCGGLQRYGFR